MKIPEKKIKAYALKNAIAHDGKANQGAVISALFNEGMKKEEVKNYLLVGDFFGRDFELNKLEFTKYKINSDLSDDSFNLNASSHQKNVIYEIYTRETDLGNKILDNEQANVREYLNKILEHKKSLKD